MSKVARNLDSTTIPVYWAKLRSCLDKAAISLTRTAFSPIIYEGYDFACALFTPQGSLVVLSSLGTPGLIGCTSNVMKHFLETYPLDSLNDGDVLITNDPWLATGHLPDISICTPIFFKGKLVAHALCIGHVGDMGGRGYTCEARSVLEEGLRIPILKLYESGYPNESLFEIIRANVRGVERVVGDIKGGVAANYVFAQELRDFLSKLVWEDISDLSQAIIERSEMAMRAAIEAIPDGTYKAKTLLDGREEDEEPLTIQVSITIDGDDLTIDYEGSSPQVKYGINSTLGMTSSYTIFGLKCIAPKVPNNQGIINAVKITAPEGSILNTVFPYPVTCRTMIAHLLPETVLMALSKANTERTIAGCGSAPATYCNVIGRDNTGAEYSSAVAERGGWGASPSKDGESAKVFPNRSRAIPTELVEQTLPILVKKKELWRDSAGAGEYRGGLGVVFEIQNLKSDESLWIHTRQSRKYYPPIGILGGKPGKSGGVLLEGHEVDTTGQMPLEKGEILTVMIPGGGGAGDPFRRTPEKVLEDVLDGKVSIEGANKEYGVIIDKGTMRIDEEVTRVLREETVDSQV